MSKTSVKSPPVWKELTWYLGANRKYWSILHSGQPCALFETEQRSDLWNWCFSLDSRRNRQSEKKKSSFSPESFFAHKSKVTHWNKNPQFTQKNTIWKSHFSQNSYFQNIIFHKIQNFKVLFFTKFTSNSWQFLDKKLVFTPVCGVRTSCQSARIQIHAQNQKYAFEIKSYGLKKRDNSTLYFNELFHFRAWNNSEYLPQYHHQSSKSKEQSPHSFVSGIRIALSHITLPFSWQFTNSVSDYFRT